MVDSTSTCLALDFVSSSDPCCNVDKSGGLIICAMDELLFKGVIARLETVLNPASLASSVAWMGLVPLL